MEKVTYTYKQILVVRTDLKMRRGKEIAQCAHASVAATIENMDHPDVIAWLDQSFAKIAVGIGSEIELLNLVNEARKRGIITRMIEDNGNTEFHGVKTLTCAAIGPCAIEKLEGLTTELKLR